MNHLSMDALLELREPGQEPGQAAARQHVDQCPSCQAELERLRQRVARLKALPTLRPARDRWPETAARFRADRRRRRVRLAGASGLAAAACVAAVVALGNLSPRSVQPNTEQLNQVMQRSQVLESALSEYNSEGRVLDGRTAGIAQQLEDRIARVDRELEATELLPPENGGQDMLKLWRERVGLLDALVDVHDTRARNAGL
jgi:anti-sigma factor RsiW